MNRYILKNHKRVLLLILATSLSSIFSSLLPYITSDFINEIETLTARKIAGHSGFSLPPWRGCCSSNTYLK